MSDLVRRRDASQGLRIALELASQGLPVLPLLPGEGSKRPVGNCPGCTDQACGGRPNMKSAGPCHCPYPCHAWAAATTQPDVLRSPQWARSWQHAAAIGYHPAGAGLTVVDLDSADAVAWAHDTLPPTLTVATTRGEHWIYAGAMASSNGVRPGVDIKSRGAHARWLGQGNGAMVPLPDLVRTLSRKNEEATPPRAGVASSTAPRWNRSPDHGCRHTERYVRTGLDRGLAKVRAHTESGASSQAFGVAKFLARQHTRCPGPCGLDAIAEELIDAAVSVDVPEPYARRAVTNGIADAGVST